MQHACESIILYFGPDIVEPVSIHCHSTFSFGALIIRPASSWHYYLVILGVDKDITHPVALNSQWICKQFIEKEVNVVSYWTCWLYCSLFSCLPVESVHPCSHTSSGSFRLPFAVMGVTITPSLSLPLSLSPWKLIISTQRVI